MADAIKKALILVGLHARLDAVEGEGGEGREDTGGGGGYLGAILPDQGVGPLSRSGLRHGGGLQ